MNDDTARLENDVLAATRPGLRDALHDLMAAIVLADLGPRDSGRMAILPTVTVRTLQTETQHLLTHLDHATALITRLGLTRMWDTATIGPTETCVPALAASQIYDLIVGAWRLLIHGADA